MRLTSKGQVTIPQHIRELAGIAPGSEVEFHFIDGKVVMEMIEPEPGKRRERLLKVLDDVAGCASAVPSMSTDEILRMTRGDD